MERPAYRNRRGELVQLEVTRHALVRFLERWRKVFPDTPIESDVEERLCDWFRRARRLEPRGRKYQVRLKRHGKDTLYFSASPFVFVVHGAAILTVELATEETRRLNRTPSVAPRATPVAAPPPPPQQQQQQPQQPKQPKQPKQPPAVPRAAPAFHIVASFRIRGHDPELVYLGEVPSEPWGGDPSRLARDPVFCEAMVRRFFAAKSRGWPIGLHARLGEDGEQTCVMGEAETSTLAGDLTRAAKLRRLTAKQLRRRAERADEVKPLLTSAG